jgi:hypothetical protein
LAFDLASYQDNEVNFLCDKRFIKFFVSRLYGLDGLIGNGDVCF